MQAVQAIDLHIDRLEHADKAVSALPPSVAALALVERLPVRQVCLQLVSMHYELAL